MDTDQYFAIVVTALVAITVLVAVAVVAVGARAGERFDRHAADALDLIAADDRSRRLDANANGTGWY